MEKWPLNEPESRTIILERGRRCRDSDSQESDADSIVIAAAGHAAATFPVKNLIVNTINDTKMESSNQMNQK